jgi:hypothetical protein
MSLSVNDVVGSPCRRTSEWAFVGYLDNGTRVGIGIYSSYRDGVAHANSWMRDTPTADRWEAEAVYEEIEEDAK